ncbi:MAG: hypothetical protein RH949_11860 [Coleofasciculus sp. A1-SPW-01]
MMDALGSEVTLMDVEESILPGFDQDIRMSVQKGFLAVAIRQGINKQELDATICIHPTIGEEVLTRD